MLSTQIVLLHTDNSLSYLLPEHRHLSIYLTNYFYALVITGI